MSWVHEAHGYQVLCNRDEKRTRKQAAPPAAFVREGVQYVAPCDGDCGGTWIASNERGMTLCLLNGATRGERFVGGRSRGLLIPELIASQSLWEMRERVWSMNLACYAPFVLVGLEPGSPATLIEWDGVETMIAPNGEPYMPVTSSSFDSDAVRQRRRAEFERLRTEAGQVDIEMLWRFHSSHELHGDAYATCMHRDDAETVSFSWVQVSGQSVEFRYWGNAPCRWRMAA
ncbi:MAG: NRDE family protein [Bryobacterales bacterium]|nr:NRDE family protein [Bryobacterales bacterium]